ncbi:MAG: cohesin domain-containing protein [Patescibacteria group bacterium]|nr:cohesin domain-containing protein [Patescibacteria group bacterium]
MKRGAIKNYKSIFIFLIFVFSLLFLIFDFCQAATLYLEPASAEYGVGETFILESRIDLEPGENINIVEVHLQYPIEILEVKDVSFGHSIFNLIPQRPIINQEQGIISFAGGVIGGYTGRIPGDPGQSNLLAKIIFHSLATGLATINFQETSRVLLNDGFGTPTNLTFRSASLKFSALEGPRLDSWQKELEKDQIPPEFFQPEIVKIDERYYLVFSTTDKQTGLDYYEISETKKEGKENWRRGESPYLLTDQSLQSFIKVKAIDKAGNERVGKIFPQIKKRRINLLTLIIAFLAAIFSLFILLKKFYPKRY